MLWNQLNTANRWAAQRPTTSADLGISNAGYGNIVPFGNGRYGYENRSDAAKENAYIARMAPTPQVQQPNAPSPQELARAWWAANNPTPAVKPVTEDPYSQTIRNIRSRFAQYGLTGSQQELNALAQAETQYAKTSKNVQLPNGGTAQEDLIAKNLNYAISKIRERFAQLGRSGSQEEFRAIQDAAIIAAQSRSASTPTPGNPGYPQYTNPYGGVLGTYPSSNFGTPGT
jgi:hypothetical protein